ncbi:MAG: hypothetical protein HFE75_12370 [Firmicutes bacterium]|jgi:hypothetical protein|nr:hypothetical protein [Bacillota bacterium]NBI64044.1 hypothetical protein [Clostridiales bacterium]
MKSTIRKRTYEAIYRLLDQVSPVDYDCGTLCGAICCTCGENDETDQELGIYLLPGEEKVLTQKENWLHWTQERAEDFDFPESWTGKVSFVKCKTPPTCPREKRPLQCRFFPLEPHLTEDGSLRLILSAATLPYACPLIIEQIALNPAFIQATYTVWTHLLQDPLIFDLVEMDSENREADDLPLRFVR